jgi:F1F0 ATPase subunit 2
MAMNESLALVLAGLAGVGLGAIFFGGLWWTVLKGLLSPRPALWLSASLLLRTSIALVGFYFVGYGHWQRLVACLIGFVMARLLVTLATRPPGQNQSSPVHEASHAP